MKQLLLIAGLALVELAPARAADFVVKSVAQQTNEVVLTLASGRLELRPLNDGSIRVRFSDGKTAETPSFVLTEKIPAPKFTARESKKTVTVATAKMQAVVDRATGAVSFRDAKGNFFSHRTAGGASAQAVGRAGTTNIHRRARL